MVKRAIDAAAWLVERKQGGADASLPTAHARTLLQWLYRASDDEAAAFVEHLGDVGYGGQGYAAALWSREIAFVLRAAEAEARSNKVPPAAWLAQELDALPLIPLDARGRREREALEDLWDLATVSEKERAAVAPAIGRIESLSARVGVDSWR